MLPSSVTALAIILIAVLPGAVYTWAFEREAGAYGVTFADRTLRFLSASVVLLTGPGWWSIRYESAGWVVQARAYWAGVR